MSNRRRLFWFFMAYVVDELGHKLTDWCRPLSNLWAYPCFWIHQHYGDAIWDSENKHWIERWRCGPILVTRDRVYVKVGVRYFILMQGKLGAFYG